MIYWEDGLTPFVLLIFHMDLMKFCASSAHNLSSLPSSYSFKTAIYWLMMVGIYISNYSILNLWSNNLICSTASVYFSELICPMTLFSRLTIIGFCVVEISSFRLDLSKFYSSLISEYFDYIWVSFIPSWIFLTLSDSLTDSYIFSNLVFFFS